MSWLSIVLVFGLAMSVFLLVIVGMAVGVILGKRELKGSCGGLAGQTSADGSTSCTLCSNSDNACRELAQRMSAAKQAAQCESHQRDSCEKDCFAEGCSKERIAGCQSETGGATER